MMYLHGKLQKRSVEERTEGWIDYTPEARLFTFRQSREKRRKETMEEIGAHLPKCTCGPFQRTAGVFCASCMQDLELELITIRFQMRASNPQLVEKRIRLS